MGHIGVLLKKRRAVKGLTAKEVASKLKIAESTYRDWENGRKIQGEPYIQISQVLDIPIGTLLGVTQSNVSEIISELEEIESKVKIIRKHVMSLI
jgi:transcriptional regulator with XRE-family HTH domain